MSRFDTYALRTGSLGLAGEDTVTDLEEGVALDAPSGGGASLGSRPLHRMRSRWDTRPSTTGDARPAFIFNALQQAFNDFGMPVEAMLSASRSLRQTLAAAKGRANIVLAQVCESIRWRVEEDA